MPEYLVRFADGTSSRVSANNVEEAKSKARAPRVNRGGPGFQPHATVTSTEETAASKMERHTRAREDAVNRVTGG